MRNTGSDTETQWHLIPPFAKESAASCLSPTLELVSRLPLPHFTRSSHGSICRPSVKSVTQSTLHPSSIPGS